MAKKEVTLRAMVAPAQTVVVSAYDEEGKAQACTLAFYMVSSHVPPCVTIDEDGEIRLPAVRASFLCDDPRKPEDH